MYFKNFNKIYYDLEGNKDYTLLTNLLSFVRVGTPYLDDITTYAYYNVKDGETPELVSYKLYGTIDYYWSLFLINENIKNYWDDWPKGQQELNQYIDDVFGNVNAIVFYPNLPLYNASTNPNSVIFYRSTKYIADTLINGDKLYSSNNSGEGVLLEKYNTLNFIEYEKTSNLDFTRYAELRFSRDDGVTIQSTGLIIDDVISRDKAPHYYEDVNGDRYFLFRDSQNYKTITWREHIQNENDEKRKIKVIKPDYMRQVSKLFHKAVREL